MQNTLKLMTKVMNCAIDIEMYVFDCSIPAYCMLYIS